MAADLQKFLFKSKFLRKITPQSVIIVILVLISYVTVCVDGQECSLECKHGKCVDNECLCDTGWSGPLCQYCGGRVRLWSQTGVISDGAGNYSEDNHCTWLVDSGRPNVSIRLHLDHFATECSWDHLYVYDGSSIYDPLLAVFSGMVVQDSYKVPHVPEVVARSGSALLHFYSDAAYNLTGFSISYKIDGCPSTTNGLECSGRGACLEGVCTCDGGWGGPACSVPLCPKNCSGNGQCKPEEHRCQCHTPYTGADCSQASDSGWWEVVDAPLDEDGGRTLSAEEISLLERSSHASVIVDDNLWIIGGHSFKKLPLIVKYDLKHNKWQAVETKSVKKMDQRYGHSAVVNNGSIYVYGGMKEDGKISRELWRLNPSNMKWSLLSSSKAHRRQDRRKQNRRRGRNKREHQEEEMNQTIRRRSRKRREELEDDDDDQDDDDDDGGGGGGDGSSGGSERRNRNKGDVEEVESICSSVYPGPCAPIATVGHAAVVVRDKKMLIIFGHSSHYGYLNTVQEYEFDSGLWVTVETKGAVVSGGYGHTAVWDPQTALVYVHGGLLSQAPRANHVSPALMTYDPFKHIWKLKTPAPIPRFLHSAVLTQGLMLVFGGNTHNDTSYSYGAKCYSADFLAYDIICNKWHTLSEPPNLYSDIARYGHSANMYKDAMYVIGGFNGRMLGSVLKYNPGSCQAQNTIDSCLETFPGRKCVWSKVFRGCYEFKGNQNGNQNAFEVCPARTTGSSAHVNYTALCAQQLSCHSCLHNTYSCVWCGNVCSHNKCSEYSKQPEGVMSLSNGLVHKEVPRPSKVVGILSSASCEDPVRLKCKSLHTCPLCRAYTGRCDWVHESCVAAPNHTISSSSSSLTLHRDREPPENPSTCTAPECNRAAVQELTSHHIPCPPSCSQRTSCSNCTQQGHCMWCFNQQRCEDNNSYLVSFPYGQCREWTTDSKDCVALEQGGSRCSLHQTCETCQADVACGWCDDGSGTGLGSCMEGGQRGPISPATGLVRSSRCPNPRWFFTSCPQCNCNGHSYCAENQTECLQPCANHTEGTHCQHCMERYWGNPSNGGLCEPCTCNDHGDTCNRVSGRCHCHTKGVSGDHCDQCDNKNHYVGDPLHGSCFYDLQIDYQFTFNLSKNEDRHIGQINFFNIPTKSDVDTDFDILCSKAANIKISAKETNQHEDWIIRNFTGTRIKRRFSASEYVFGGSGNNTTFFVYVYNFTPPIEIVVSFSQHPKLDLIQFFTIFSLCFLLLLLLAAFLWKIKQKYDLYTRRQRLMVEMEAMASRPFRPILLEMDRCSYTLTSAANTNSNNNTSNTTSPTVNSDQNHVPTCNNIINSNFNTNHITNSIANHCNNVLIKHNNSVSPEYLLPEPPDTIHSSVRKRKKNPSPISLEPCCGNRAAVLSLVVQLPTGGEPFTPHGHPGGLAIASTLVTLGNPRKCSVDPACLTKGGDKTKSARGKQQQHQYTGQHHPDTCI
ncbi:attractin-like protein dsd isoform X2 [Oratosquilla oratoria]|uniref:attractin-like protein dsd isoform X2 n=1 Tax=Oratosquilla oratoria TaxID=337810 RepID=UPI003F76BF87